MILLGDSATDWVRVQVEGLAQALSTPGSAVYPFEVRALLAILLVSFSCGIVGSLVVGNRMAFFSDAMAHTAFAGVAFSLLAIVAMAGVSTPRQAEPYLWIVPWAMCGIGAAAGITIAFVRERTNLGNDTVIGVFFALALGLAAVLLPALRQRVNLDPESILFGQLTLIGDRDLLGLGILAILTASVVAWRYNSFVFSSFNPGLAKSRGLPVRWNNYLFIVLLALVVNLSIKAVGILLINALLVVPAAAAANCSRNLRRMFWFTLAGSILCGLAGYRWSTRAAIPAGVTEPLRVGPAGMVVCVCVGWFFASIGIRAVRQRFFGAAIPAGACTQDHGDGQYPHTH
jgi:zinc transport system permease protein